MPDALTTAEIEEALAVCAAATPGPWISVDEDFDDDGYAEPLLMTEDDRQVATVRVGLKETTENQEFIALARTLLPRALRALLAARRDIQTLTEVLDAHQSNTEEYLEADDAAVVLDIKQRNARAKETP